MPESYRISDIPRRPRVPVPEPYEDVPSLHKTVNALKEGYEELSGQRGNARAAAVTWDDLVRLGLIVEDQIPTDVGTPRPVPR